MPHGHCYLWTPGLVWLQVGSNALIGASYVAIAATLAFLVRQIEDLPFKLMYLAFGVFIIACGFTHFFDVLTVWRPLYWVDGWVRALTAVASMGTAVLLPPLVPQALELARAARLAHSRGEELKIAHANLEGLYEKARREAEQAVAEKMEQTRLLAEAIPQLVWTSDAQGKVDYRNQRWQSYAGQDFSASGPGGTSQWIEIIHAQDREQAEALFRRSMESGEPLTIEFRLRRADGAYRWHLLRAVPLRNREGGVVRWFGTATDIEDQHRAVETMEAAVRARDEFLSIASHELRTPLTALSIDVEAVAASEQVPERMRRRASRAGRQVRRVATLVEQLLDVTRIQAERLELERAPVDLADVVRSAAGEAAETARAAGCELRLQLEEGLSGDWDRTRLEQVVTNLLANALRYGAGRPVTLTTVRKGSAAVLSVADQGPGIAAADHGRLFERFGRLSPARHYGGLGLGLWLSRQIALAHGGDVTVASEQGAGATFQLSLPLEARDGASRGTAGAGSTG